MQKLFIVAFLGLVAIISLILFSWTGSVVFSILTVFPFFKKGFVDAANYSEALASFLSVVLTTGVLYGGFNFFRFNKQRRMKGLLTLSVCIASYYLLVWFGSS